MKNILAILFVLILSSCVKERKYEFRDGLILIDKSGTVEFAKESGSDTITVKAQTDGTYRIIGLTKHPKSENKLSIHINELKER